MRDIKKKNLDLKLSTSRLDYCVAGVARQCVHRNLLQVKVQMEEKIKTVQDETFFLIDVILFCCRGALV